MTTHRLECHKFSSNIIYCCVSNCNNNSKSCPDEIFHPLPVNNELVICECIGLDNSVDPLQFLNKQLKICDQHFKENIVLKYLNSEQTSTTENITDAYSHPIVENKNGNFIITNNENFDNGNEKGIIDTLISNENISTVKISKLKNVLHEKFVQNVNEICRICLLNGRDFKKINSDYFENISIFEMLGQCIDLQTKEEKMMPQNICIQCTADLKFVYEFLKKSQNSQMSLKKQLSHQNILSKNSFLNDHSYILPNFDSFTTKPDFKQFNTDLKHLKISKTISTVTTKDIINQIENKTLVNLEGKNYFLAKAFSCKKCQEIFISLDLLRGHDCKSPLMVLDTPVDNITIDKVDNNCPKCFETIPEFSDILKHNCKFPKNISEKSLSAQKCLKSSSEFSSSLKMYPCPDCDMTFKYFQGLVAHKRIKKHGTNEIKIKTVRCGRCNIIFSTSEELKNHRKESHSSSRIVTCPTCMKRMRPQDYLRHKRMHSAEFRFCCEICGKRFRNKTNFQHHMDIHLDKKPFVCDVCNKGFRIKLKMSEHRLTHFEERRYMCDSCGKTFRQKVGLQAHVHKKRCGKSRGDTLKHECPECNEKFYTLRELSGHKQQTGHKKTGQSRRPGERGPRVYKCEVCNSPFDNMADLKNHEPSHGEKTHTCQHCNRSFFSPLRLQRHLKVTHDDALKKHCCGVCGKAFVTRLGLSTHATVHTGEKKYRCDFCDKTFSQKGHLISHNRTHTGSRPYQCPFCDKTFALNGNLTVHIRTHTGIRPYRCEFCENAFYDSSSAKRHMSMKHGVVWGPTE